MRLGKFTLKKKNIAIYIFPIISEDCLLTMLTVSLQCCKSYRVVMTWQ